MSIKQFFDDNVIFEQNNYDPDIPNNIGLRIEITQRLKDSDNKLLNMIETQNFMQENRSKTSICVLLDNSGSMSGPPLENSKKVIKYFVQNVLHSKDYFSLITFNSEARMVINKMIIENNVEDILTKISMIEASSYTNIPDAIKMGISTMEGNLDGYTKNILLFTDGMNTIGPKDCKEIISCLNTTLPNWHKNSINCCGFGSDVDLETLNVISKESESKIMVIDNSSDIIHDFIDMFLNLIHQNDKEVLIRFEHQEELSKELVKTDLKEVYFTSKVQKFRIPKTIIGESNKINISFENVNLDYFSKLKVELEIHDIKNKTYENKIIIIQPTFEKSDEIEFNYDVTIDFLDFEYQKIMKIFSKNNDTSMLKKFSKKCKNSGVPIDNPRLKELISNIKKISYETDDYQRARLTMYASPYVVPSNGNQSGGFVDSPLRSLSSQMASNIIE